MLSLYLTWTCPVGWQLSNEANPVGCMLSNGASQSRKVDRYTWQMNKRSSSAEIAKASEGHRESYSFLVDNQDYNVTFHVIPPE